MTELKLRVKAVTGVSVRKQQLAIRGKIREDYLSLKKHGLVGGEEVILCEDFINRTKSTDFVRAD